jgi:NhaP-type Na+/H+ or K+/H+ antiporter
MNEKKTTAIVVFLFLLVFAMMGGVNYLTYVWLGLPWLPAF